MLDRKPEIFSRNALPLACPRRAYMEEDNGGEGFGSLGRVVDLRELQPPA